RQMGSRHESELDRLLDVRDAAGIAEPNTGTAERVENMRADVVELESFADGECVAGAADRIALLACEQLLASQAGDDARSRRRIARTDQRHGMFSLRESVVTLAAIPPQLCEDDVCLGSAFGLVRG